MANEIQYRGTETGVTLYATIRSASGTQWNTAGTPNFEAVTAANWADYDIALAESAGNYFYVGTFPAITGNMVAGWYWVDVYKRAGGAPAITDTLQGTVVGYWDGTSLLPWASNAKTVSDKSGYSLTAATGLGNQTANITGNLSGSVGSVTGAVGSVTGAVGSVTAGVTVTTNNDKSGYSLTATTGLGNQTANITGTVSGNSTLSTSDLTTAINTAWTTTTLAEDYPADNTAATPAELLYLILSACTQFSISGLTLTQYKLDGTTTAATYTLDSATTPTQRIRAT